MNYIFFISYNGLFYQGSQSQLNFSTISDYFNYKFFKFNKKINKILLSSRTDKGVNSLFQIVQIFSKNYYLKKKLINNLNKSKLSIFNLIQVSSNFHCIYSVLSRTYCYVFCFKNFIFNYNYYLNYNLNIYLIIYFYKHILGLKNFFIFDFYKNFFFYNSKKLIYEINIYKKNIFIYLIFKGNSFLYNMIRNMISYLLYYIYNNYNLYIFLNFFYLKNNLYFLKPIFSNFLFLININYLL